MKQLFIAIMALVLMVKESDAQLYDTRPQMTNTPLFISEPYADTASMLEYYLDFNPNKMEIRSFWPVEQLVCLKTKVMNEGEQWCRHWWVYKHGGISGTQGYYLNERICARCLRWETIHDSWVISDEGQTFEDLKEEIK